MKQLKAFGRAFCRPKAVRWGEVRCRLTTGHSLWGFTRSVMADEPVYKSSPVCRGVGFNTTGTGLEVGRLAEGSASSGIVQGQILPGSFTRKFR